MPVVVVGPLCHFGLLVVGEAFPVSLGPPHHCCSPVGIVDSSFLLLGLPLHCWLVVGVSLCHFSLLSLLSLTHHHWLVLALSQPPLCCWHVVSGLPALFGHPVIIGPSPGLLVLVGVARASLSASLHCLGIP